jgi:hypothetical protein
MRVVWQIEYSYYTSHHLRSVHFQNILPTRRLPKSPSRSENNSYELHADAGTTSGKVGHVDTDTVHQGKDAGRSSKFYVGTI